jgi:biotin-dependent carboxylase-like uncharacterized protein
MIEIVEAGLSTTVQDRGRPGLASIGVSPSGAVDPALAARCNRLVGNAEDAAVLESAGGLRLRAIDAAVAASDVEPAARVLRAGEELVVPVGVRQWHYVALRGGIAVDPVLGSCSTDTLGGIGPAAVCTGDRLVLGPEPAAPPSGEIAPVRDLVASARVTPGPRHDWFASNAWATLVGADWTVTLGSRVGVRLAGPLIARARVGELASEGLVRGAIQVPPDGQPVMMLADHPTTGGYPVIAVVDPTDVAALAQTLPGGRVRFRG